jgi:hypothetical protein
MTRATLIVTLVVVSLCIIGHQVGAQSSTTAASAHGAQTPPPVISTNGQLAAVIRRHDMRAGGAGPFTPQVTVTCRRATSRHGGSYDHRCRETYLAALCIVGSTPEVEVLKVDVPARGYHTVETRTLDAGACSPP